jgi:hypothetical protein
MNLEIPFLRKNGKGPHRRRSKRICLKIGFEILGQDEHEFPFRTQAGTINVSTRGCCLCLHKDLARGQFLTLISPKGVPFVAKVCWSKYSPKNDLRFVGLSLPFHTTGWVISDQSQGQ